MSETGYVLALDLGTSRVAAATARLAPSGEIDTDSLVLGHGSGSIVAAAFATDEGDVLFGDAAERRGFLRPDRLVRDFIRNVGDDVPVLVGDRSAMPEALVARLILWVLDCATRREGLEPAALVLALPSSWTAQRADALRTGLAAVGIDDARFLSSAEAAAHHRSASHPLSPGDVVAVYDLGATSFESAVVRACADGEFTVLGESVSVSGHGGSLFDDAVLDHAITAAGAHGTTALHNPHARVPLARLRRASIAAKHALSFDAEATIPFPGRGGGVRITRSEFEAMIEPTLERTLDALEQSMESAHRTREQVDLILLVGGSTHIPLVAQLLSDRFDRPLVAASDSSVALGAARAGMLRVQSRDAESAPLAVHTEPVPSGTAPPTAARGSWWGGGGAGRLRLGRQAPAATVASLLAVAAIVGVSAAAVAFGSRDGDTPQADSALAASAGQLAVMQASAGRSALASPLRDAGTGVPTPLPVPPPTTDVAPERDGDAPIARRVSQPLDDSSRPGAPSGTAPTASSPSAQTPAAPAPIETQPPADPPPVDPPPVDLPPADPPPSDPPPVDPPPVDPPPADPLPSDPAPVDQAPPADTAPAASASERVVEPAPEF